MKKNINKTANRIAIAATSVIIVFVLLLSSITTISTGEVGIRVRFGKVVNSSTKEGVNFKIPFVERIEKMNIKVQKTELDVSSASSDLQDVNMSLAVNYRVNSEDAKNLYKTVGQNYEDTILEPSIKESIKSVVSQYTAEELITKRSEVSKKCLDTLQSKVEKYGITIDDFNITNFNFSAEFNTAIEEKQVAEQKVLTAKQELEREKIEAEKKIVAAKAEKEANELKEKSLTDNIIKEKFINKWNGQLPKVTSSNNILDVTNLLGD